MSKRKIVFLIILLIGFVSCLVILLIPRENVILVNPIYTECNKEYIELHDYVFIAKINKKTKTKTIINGTFLDIPRTFYDIDVIEVLKGDNIPEESEIRYIGGRWILNTYCYYNTNYGMLQIGEYYLFLSNMTNDKDLFIGQDIQYELLEGYDDSKTIDNQNEEIIDIINKYKNYL